MGGMYVDFDYESILSIESLIQDKKCCFALDPISHRNSIEQEFMLNGALMLSIPNHWFMNKIIKTVFSKMRIQNDNRDKSTQVFTSAGPWMIIELYNSLSEREKENIFLLSDRLVSPFDCWQSQKFIKGEMSEEELDIRLKDAYAVHYFFGNWR